MLVEIIRIILTNRQRIGRLRKKLFIAVAALEKLSEPLCGEWHVDIAKKALEEMKLES